ncbi:sel1 repeat family protein [Providencia rettgeri]|uniref:Sel1 repeat family protein n=1 Tax=Providencia hangzhouensis TaxID=3031799 RepID=A0ABY9ZCX6_9GAMM|nr:MULTISPECIES: sel1 repeat family protein [Providencia]QLI96839.1 sel1 repeat family protein [Providencia rettgeri]WNK25600.1 sel1 repeat family protein [Providencia hangzhouensis]
MGFFDNLFSKSKREPKMLKAILNSGARLHEAEVDILFIIKNGNVLYVNYDTENLFEIDGDGDSLFKGRVVNYKHLGETTKDEVQIFVGFNENDAYTMFTLQLNLEDRLELVGQALTSFFSNNRINGVFSWEGYSVQYQYTYKLYNKNNINFLINSSQTHGYLISEDTFEQGEGDILKEKFWSTATNADSSPETYTYNDPKTNTGYSVSSSCIKSTNEFANKIYEQGVESLKKADFKMAFNNFKIAAKYGHTSATFNLALMYKNGNGCDYSYEDALQLFIKSQNEGHQGAFRHIDELESVKERSNDLSNLPLVINEASHLHDGTILYFFYFFLLNNLSEVDIVSWIRYELDCASLGNELAQQYVNEISPNRHFYKNGGNELTPHASLFSDLFDNVTIPLRKEEDFSDIIKLRCNLVKNLFKHIFEQ